MSYENHNSYLVSSYGRLSLLAGMLIIFITYTSFFKILFYENHNSYLVSSHGPRPLNAMPVLKSRLINTTSTYHSWTRVPNRFCGMLDRDYFGNGKRDVCRNSERDSGQERKKHRDTEIRPGYFYWNSCYMTYICHNKWQLWSL